MDQKELIDRLRRDPKAVQSLMTSADGQRLMQLLQNQIITILPAQASPGRRRGCGRQHHADGADAQEHHVYPGGDRPAAAHPGQSAGIERRTAVCRRWTRN